MKYIINEYTYTLNKQIHVVSRDEIKLTCSIVYNSNNS